MGARRLAPWRTPSETLLAIDRLKELQPDWDSYGAGEIALSAREQAKRFITLVGTTLGAAYARPIVGPTVDGGVALIWRQGAGQPKVEAFFSPEANRYVVIHGRGIVDRGSIEGLEFIRRYVTL